jgi:hypothetical protein
MGAGLDWLLARVSKCPVSLACAVWPVTSSPAPTGALPLTRATFEPKSCSISVARNEWENGEWVVKKRSIYGVNV